MADLRVNIKAIDNATKTLRNVERDMKALFDRIGLGHKSILTLNNAMKAFAVIGAVKGLKSTTDSLLEARKEMQALENRMSAAVITQQNYADSMRWLREMTDDAGLQFTKTADGFAGFAASMLRGGATMDQVKETFYGVTKAAVSMQLPAEKTSLIFYALTQMSSKGRVSMEELSRQLGESLPGALQIGARAMDMTTGEFIKMVSTGKLLSSEFLPKFAKQVEQELGGSFDKAKNSVVAAENRMGNAFFRLRESIGKAIEPVAIEYFGKIADKFDGIKINSEELIPKIRAVAEALKNIAVEVVKVGKVVYEYKAFFLTYVAANAMAQLSLKLLSVATAFKAIGVAVWSIPLAPALVAVTALGAGFVTLYNQIKRAADEHTRLKLGISGAEAGLDSPEGAEAYFEIVGRIIELNKEMEEQKKKIAPGVSAPGAVVDPARLQMIELAAKKEKEYIRAQLTYGENARTQIETVQGAIDTYNKYWSIVKKNRGSEELTKLKKKEAPALDATDAAVSDTGEKEAEKRAKRIAEIEAILQDARIKTIQNASMRERAELDNRYTEYRAKYADLTEHIGKIDEAHLSEKKAMHRDAMRDLVKENETIRIAGIRSESQRELAEIRANYEERKNQTSDNINEQIALYRVYNSQRLALEKKYIDESAETLKSARLAAIENENRKEIAAIDEKYKELLEKAEAFGEAEKNIRDAYEVERNAAIKRQTREEVNDRLAASEQIVGATTNMVSKILQANGREARGKKILLAAMAAAEGAYTAILAWRTAFESRDTGSFYQKLASAIAASALVTGNTVANVVAIRRTDTSYAMGTRYAAGGLAKVGEHGPEIVNIPRGSVVSNASETRAITNTHDRYDNRQQTTTMNFYNTTQAVMREMVRAIKDGGADDFLRYAKLGMARI